MSSVKSKIAAIVKALLPKRIRRLSYWVPPFHLNSLVVIVGQACNYKCRDCGNFCPIAPVEFKRYSLESVIKSLEVILNHVGYVYRIQIQGGEPLLYSDLGGVIGYLGKKRNKVFNIEIATNGSIVPSDDLMSIFHRNGVKIRISNYGLSLDKIENLKEVCQKYKVDYYMHNFASKDSSWYLLGGKELCRDNNELETQERFNSCRFNTCLTLERGELAYCSRATNSYHIQGYERRTEDYVKVIDSAEFKKELMQYVRYPKAMEACRYCNGTSEDLKVEPAIQMNNKII